ncbi:MAG: LptF/LptG family permease [Epsilonproteobacteria bacterium]|nr:LptF/LptG family permease [Campylobacterota bacterium]
MDKTVSGYLIRTFSGLFFSIFSPIIAIGSLILFIRIAKLTEVTHMSVEEMFLMYSYFIPTMLFYTLPITFFAALTLTMVRLSNDFENIVLFSFGIAPKTFLRYFAPLTLAATALLLLLSLALIPITKQLIKSFVNYKSIHAVLNIEASQFGQKFGDWLVFLADKDKKKNILINLVLLNSANPKEEQFLTAKYGKFFNENGIRGLKLYYGQAYRISDEQIDQINYKAMKIYHTQSVTPFSYRNLKEYWQAAGHDRKRRKDLIIYIAVSLFPIVSLFFAFAYGILHPRYDKNFSYPAILAVTTLYYGVISSIAKTTPAGSALFVIAVTAAGVWLFYKRIEQRF